MLLLGLVLGDLVRHALSACPKSWLAGALVHWLSLVDWSRCHDVPRSPSTSSTQARAGQPAPTHVKASPKRSRRCAERTHGEDSGGDAGPAASPDWQTTWLAAFPRANRSWGCFVPLLAMLTCRLLLLAFVCGCLDLGLDIACCPECCCGCGVAGHCSPFLRDLHRQVKAMIDERHPPKLLFLAWPLCRRTLLRTALRPLVWLSQQLAAVLHAACQPPQQEPRSTAARAPGCWGLLRRQVAEPSGAAAAESAAPMPAQAPPALTRQLGSTPQEAVEAACRRPAAATHATATATPPARKSRKRRSKGPAASPSAAEPQGGAALPAAGLQQQAGRLGRDGTGGTSTTLLERAGTAPDADDADVGSFQVVRRKRGPRLPPPVLWSVGQLQPATPSAAAPAAATWVPPPSPHSTPTMPAAKAFVASSAAASPTHTANDSSWDTPRGAGGRQPAVPNSQQQQQAAAPSWAAAMGGAGGAGSDDDDGSMCCVVCLCEPREVGMLHGATVHCCLCSTCARLWQPGQECPLCRQVVERMLAVF